MSDAMGIVQHRLAIDNFFDVLFEKAKLKNLTAKTLVNRLNKYRFRFLPWTCSHNDSTSCRWDLFMFVSHFACFRLCLDCHKSPVSFFGSRETVFAASRRHVMLLIEFFGSMIRPLDKIRCSLFKCEKFFFSRFSSRVFVVLCCGWQRVSRSRDWDVSKFYNFFFFLSRWADLHELFLKLMFLLSTLLLSCNLLACFLLEDKFRRQDINPSKRSCRITKLFKISRLLIAFALSVFKTSIGKLHTWKIAKIANSSSHQQSCKHDAIVLRNFINPPEKPQLTVTLREHFVFLGCLFNIRLINHSFSSNAKKKKVRNKQKNGGI